MGWKIYYDDETVVADTDMAWVDAPLYGVLFVVEDYPDQTKLVHMGMDYYLKKGPNVISFSEISAKMHMELGIPARAAKYGRWAPDAVWQRVHDAIFPK